MALGEKERVIAALKHQQPDRTPYSTGFTQKAWQAMVAFCGTDEFNKKIDNAVHGVGPKPGPRAQELSPTLVQDEFGVQWDKSVDKDIGVVCNCLLPERTLDKYAKK